MTVHVVMGNDYPAAVFGTESAAEAFCAERRAECDKAAAAAGARSPVRRIYWRVYSFEVII